MDLMGQVVWMMFGVGCVLAVLIERQNREFDQRIASMLDKSKK